METPEQRAERIARLEQQRQQRQQHQPRQELQAETVWPTPDDAGTGVVPIEIAPGRGDLSYGLSGWLGVAPTALQLIGNRTVSFARIFMSQPWVAAAVMRLMTWSVRVPLKAYRRLGDDPTDRIRLRPGDHPLADALVNPWLGGDQAHLIMAALGPVLVHGNAVTEVLSGAGESIQFDAKDWRFCRPIMPWRGSLEGFQFDSDNVEFTRTVSKDQVWHTAWWSPAGPLGVSPLQQLGTTLQIEDAAQRHTRSMLANGARTASAIQASEAFITLDPDERQQIMRQLRKDLTNLYTGPENSGRPALLPPGLTWNAVGQTADEADLVEQRKLTREEVCAVYQLQPGTLGLTEKIPYSNLQAQREMTYTDSLGPPMVLIEQAINAQVVRDLLREDDVIVEFDFGVVLRGDRLAEIGAMRDGIATALVTPNEGRAALNLPQSDDPGMDRFYLPQNNLQPIGAHPNAPGAAPSDTAAPPGDAGINVTPDQSGRRLHVRSRDADYQVALP